MHGKASNIDPTLMHIGDTTGDLVRVQVSYNE